MKDYALFLGCMIPLRLPNLEASARRVLGALGVKLLEMKETSRCPDPVGIQSLDYATWLALGARNIAIAEEMNTDILTLCNGCFETLKTVNETLKKDLKLTGRRKFNACQDRQNIQGQDRGQAPARGPTQRDRTTEDKGEHHHKLERAECGYSLRLPRSRPSSILRVDNPEEPRLLDELVEATGARSVPYLKKLACCGATIRGIDKDGSLDFTYEKIQQAVRSSADCLVVLCPTCFLQFDTGQVELRSAKKADYNLPVLYLPELIGIAFGMNSEELGLSLHKIKTKGLLEKVS